MYRRAVLNALLVSGCTDTSMDDETGGSTGAATLDTLEPGSSEPTAGGSGPSSSGTTGVETSSSTGGPLIESASDERGDEMGASSSMMIPDSGSASSESTDGAHDETSGGAADLGDSGDPAVPPEDAVWLMAGSPALTLVNVLDPSQRFTDLLPRNGALQEPALHPWSDDGDWLARDHAGALQIHALRRGGAVVASVPHTEPWEIIGWAYHRGVIAVAQKAEGREVLLVTPSGETHAIVSLGDDQEFIEPSIAYNGGILVYADQSPTGYDLFYVDLYDLTAPTPPELLVAGLPSAMRDPKWTLDSRWLAFGIQSRSNAAQGVYLWNPDLGEPPTRVAPDDAEYAEHYAFSPQRHDFMRFGTTPEGASFITHVRLDDTILRTSELSAGTNQSPAQWSSDGTYVTYSADEEGWLRAIYRTSLGQPIRIPGYRFSCPLAWASPTEFVYRACAGEAQGELFWGVAASPLPVEPIALGFRDAEFATGGGCVALWDDARLHVGSALSTPELTPVVSPMPAIDEATVDPYGTGLAWVTRQGFSYWQPLLDCQPQGAPAMLDRDGVLEPTLLFLPH